ncbi:hypothetical protein TOPH_09234 [Tolypocladium ophioglossoides CBS 100239]|uniref:Uncharacterized protein n=1 Tax=Tolypocladium ophioglossoides (strain CBS 100239) TaxID=1163406 RepID=A0A0L0MW90_TOLOC|nr:hypothetical protein TOPH_09234 [Tolypocladium ophioglossoides CBS 100239]
MCNPQSNSSPQPSQTKDSHRSDPPQQAVRVRRTQLPSNKSPSNLNYLHAENKVLLIVPSARFPPSPKKQTLRPVSLVHSRSVAAETKQTTLPSCKRSLHRRSLAAPRISRIDVSHSGEQRPRRIPQLPARRSTKPSPSAPSRDHERESPRPHETRTAKQAPPRNGSLATRGRLPLPGPRFALSAPSDPAVALTTGSGLLVSKLLSPSRGRAVANLLHGQRQQLKLASRHASIPGRMGSVYAVPGLPPCAHDTHCRRHHPAVAAPSWVLLVVAAHPRRLPPLALLPALRGRSGHVAGRL